jgi:hypothetical protein
MEIKSIRNLAEHEEARLRLRELVAELGADSHEAQAQSLAIARFERECRQAPRTHAGTGRRLRSLDCLFRSFEA